MPRKGIPRDPNLDCPAVKAYREIVHLNMNYLQRQYVVENVQCTERGLRIWQAVLVEHMLLGYNPKNVPFMVKQWANMYYDPARQDPCWQDTTETQWKPDDENHKEPDSSISVWRD